MNRIDQLFEQKHGNILSIYFCAGHPHLDSTMPVLKALQDNGADMVEIGIPFSDPMADGPVIQQAATTALRNGMSLRRLFSQLGDMRQTIHMPVLLMGYLNVILQFGFERFCQECNRCGVDGAIIPDLPFDVYMKDYKPTAERYGIDIIMLITPHTSDERIRLIDNNTHGFIYQVSTDATTGVQNTFSPATIDYFKRIKDMQLHHPTLVGFGISNKATLTASRQNSCGSIIGSKFVRLLEEHATPDEAAKALFEALEK
jgi:tryptophan synthase alpha chain